VDKKRTLDFLTLFDTITYEFGMNVKVDKKRTLRFMRRSTPRLKKL
jgi:hypothetical protein